MTNWRWGLANQEQKSHPKVAFSAVASARL